MISLVLKNKDIVTLEIAGEIVELDYPSQVTPGTPFNISYGAKNISTTSYIFFGFFEDDLGIIPGTDWIVEILPNSTHYPPTLTHPGITEPITLTLTLGHIEMPGICNWILLQGGYTNLTILNVFEILDSYIFQQPPSGYTFIPTLQNVFGVIDYYLGFDGDAGTGCSFYEG